MNKSNSITWFEWFTKSKQREFEEKTKKLWGLTLRNGIAATLFKKWLREELCAEIKDHDVDNKQIEQIENLWARQKNIAIEKFREYRKEILKKCNMSEDNFKLYCINELKAIKWAEVKWEKAVEQIYLETKEAYDEVKLRMITIPEIEKGLTLEVYQQLKEEEKDFTEITQQSSYIRYQSDPEGTWYKKTSLRKELFQKVNRMKEGELSAPFKIKDRYTIIELQKSRGTELTTYIRKKILNEQLTSFIDYGVEQLLDHASM